MTFTELTNLIDRANSNEDISEDEYYFICALRAFMAKPEEALIDLES